MNSSAQFIRVTGIGSRTSVSSLARCLERVSGPVGHSSQTSRSPLSVADEPTVAIIGPAADLLGEVVTLKLRSP